jgi:hypothetical protein
VRCFTRKGADPPAVGKLPHCKRSGASRRIIRDAKTLSSGDGPYETGRRRKAAPTVR